MQKITVSILHYNNQKDTIDCIDSLLESNFSGYELFVYVLDNGSTEELIVDTKKYSEINLRVERVKENLGFTGGHNKVYQQTKNDDANLFLLLNNDSMVEKDCVKNLLNGIGQDDVAGVVPKIYFTKGREYHKNRYKEDELGKVIWYAGGDMDWGNVTSKHRGVDEVDNGQFDNNSEIDFASGACLLLKRSVIDVTGLFDDSYFLYYEDADLSARLKKTGCKLMYISKAVVWHNNAGSSGSGSALHDYYLTRNKLIFGMKFTSSKVKAHLLKEAFRIGLSGRTWQKKGVFDYFTHKFGKGSYGN